MFTRSGHSAPFVQAKGGLLGALRSRWLLGSQKLGCAPRHAYTGEEAGLAVFSKLAQVALAASATGAGKRQP